MTLEVDGRIHVKLGAKGGWNSGDKPWDDGVAGQVKQILLWHDNYYIYGIQTVYERNGVKQISKKHGGAHGNFDMINLRRPLTWVSGTYVSNCPSAIASLKFGNEEETYGPFGIEKGTAFVFRARSEITGFHGSSFDASTSGSGYISSIGLYLRTEAVGIVGELSRSSTAQGTVVKGEK